MAISYKNVDTDSTIYSIDFNSGDASPREEYILVNMDNNTPDEDSIIYSETVLDRLMDSVEE